MKVETANLNALTLMMPAPGTAAPLALRQQRSRVRVPGPVTASLRLKCGTDDAGTSRSAAEQPGSGGPGVGLAGPGVAAGFNLKFTVKLPVSHWQQWRLRAVTVRVPITGIVIIRVRGISDSDSPSHLRSAVT
jgi:hypothetical protein